MATWSGEMSTLEGVLEVQLYKNSATDFENSMKTSTTIQF